MSVLFWVTLVKLITEIALLALLGRWVLRAWLVRAAPDRGRHNPVLWVFDTVCHPLLRLGGWLSPRLVLARHHALVVFLLLMFTWGGVTVAKIAICLDIGVTACR
jgi:hypothetical protein